MNHPETVLNDIPADEIIVLSAQFDRAFRAVGCTPSCHCCRTSLEIGDKFKLAMVEQVEAAGLSSRMRGEPRDEMLCTDCTPAKLLRKRRKAKRDWEAAGRGYSRAHE